MLNKKYRNMEGKLIKKITSKNNDKYKLIKSLGMSKYRNREKLYLAEGLRTVELALEFGKVPKFIAVNETFLNKNPNMIDELKDTEVFVFPDDLFEKVISTENSQGIIAVMKMDNRKFEDFSGKNIRNILVVDRVQDPGNMGTIIRTADAFGIDLLIVVNGSVDVYNPKVVRSAMGSLFYMDFIYADEKEAFEFLKKEGFILVSSSLEAKTFFDKVDYPEKTALVVGNEANGISDFWIKNSDRLVKIPMFGKAESLNVSISAAILMYEIIKR